MNTEAFIDGQNLYLGTITAKPKWKIDLKKFRTYLARKYHVVTAYYFLGTFEPKHLQLYDEIKRSGFVVIFRHHSKEMISAKKGNVDTDIVFEIMSKLYKNQVHKIILVSGDGDYYKMVNFLITENRLEKVLFPAHKKSSSLYKKLEPKFFDYLDNPDIKRKISTKNAGSP